MASIAGLYSFGARSRGVGRDEHGEDHRADHSDRGGVGGFSRGLFKKGKLGCSNNTTSQSGWFGVLGGEHSGETHITGITGITGTSELLDGEDLLTIGDREQ